MSDPAEVHPRELLSAYLDDELDVPERSKVDLHLAACEDCRMHLAALNRLARAVAGEDVPQVPADLLERTGRRLDAATVVRSRRFGLVLPASIAATIAALGILVALQWRQGRIGETALPLPESKQETPAEMTRATPQAPPPSPSGTALADKKIDRLEKDEQPQVVPSQDAPAARQAVLEPVPKESKPKVKVYEVPGGVPEGVLGGAAGGVEGGVVARAPSADASDERVDGAREREQANALKSLSMQRAAAKAALIGSPCEDRWSDSGVHGSLEAPDVEAAAAELTRVAREAGGAAIWRGASDGRPIVLAVPRDRLDDVLAGLRARRVTGLPDRPSLAPADDCAGISVALTAAPPSP
jgi:hypothetical protein